MTQRQFSPQSWLTKRRVIVLLFVLLVLAGTGIGRLPFVPTTEPSISDGGIRLPPAVPPAAVPTATPNEDPVSPSPTTDDGQAPPTATPVPPPAVTPDPTPTPTPTAVTVTEEDRRHHKHSHSVSSGASVGLNGTGSVDIVGSNVDPGYNQTTHEPDFTTPQPR
ncbi:MAG: hypothetical protein ABEI77_03895 [Halorientalis sp.]